MHVYLWSFKVEPTGHSVAKLHFLHLNSITFDCETRYFHIFNDRCTYHDTVESKHRHQMYNSSIVGWSVYLLKLINWLAKAVDIKYLLTGLR